MEYLDVKNWEEYQHYKDRCPPWIKLHTKILNDRNFSMLSCASRGLLMQLWILASEHEGKIPNDLEEIKFRLRDNAIKQEQVNMLISKGFLINCKHALADDSTAQADAVPETEERREETEVETEGEGEGEFKNVKLSEGERKKLFERFGEKKAKDLIERLSRYIASKGKKYKSHYATMLNWERRDRDGPQNTPTGDDTLCRKCGKKPWTKNYLCDECYEKTFGE
jgi:hypothetical protein